MNSINLYRSQSIAQAIRAAAIEKLNGQPVDQKIIEEIEQIKPKPSKPKFANIIRSNTVRSSDGDIKRLFFHNNRHNFQTLDEAMIAFQKHSERIALKLQAEREEK